MANGTTIKVYVKHLHRSNAESVKEDAKSMMEYLERKAIAIAATNGNTKPDDEGGYWYEHVIHEIPELMQEYADNYYKSMMAGNVIDFPEDCRDDFDNLEDSINETRITE